MYIVIKKNSDSIFTYLFICFKDFTYILFLGKFNDELQSLEKRVINLGGNSDEDDDDDDKIFNKNHSNIHRHRIKGYKCYAFILVDDIKPKSLTNLIRKVDIILFTFNLNENLF